ncbi:MAG: omptin family outer membrane protease [Spirochaetales bacterium]|nr:omptin family outer membrane protease [Spirochaetales bacterium]
MPGIPLGGQPYRFSLSLRAGLLSGAAYEEVYRSAERDQFLSELTWEVKPLYYGGVCLEFGQENPRLRAGFFTRLDLKTGLPGVTGVMEDRDWLGRTADGGNTGLSHFSSHTNTLRQFVALDFQAGLSFPLGGSFVLRCLGGGSAMHLYWEASDGYTQYGMSLSGALSPGVLDDVHELWSPSLPKVPVYGLGISYVQDWVVFHLGLGLGYSRGPWAVDLLFLGSVLTFCRDYDIHHHRDIEFIGFYVLAFFGEPSIRISRTLIPGLEADLALSYRWLEKAQGKAVINYLNTGAKGENYGGASYAAFDLSLGFRVTL